MKQKKSLAGSFSAQQTPTLCNRKFSYENGSMREVKQVYNSDEKKFIAVLISVAGAFFLSLILMSCIYG